MAKAKIAIGFLNGDICIRYNYTEYIPQDKNVYLPLLKSKIDEYIINSDILSISTIILSALKDISNIKSIFKRPTSTSVVPADDCLYIELEKYVQNNTLYIQKKEAILLERKEKSNLIKENSKDSFIYYSYVTDSIKERERHYKKAIK